MMQFFNEQEINALIEKFKKRELKAKQVFDIREIGKEESFQFVKRYHYLGDAKFFAKYAYGLTIGSALVGVATYALPQGNVALKGWFGLGNDEQSILELTRLCMLPSLNGSNATSYLLSGSIRKLKRYGIRAVITLATSDRHVGSIYQVCNFKYYGLTDPKDDFYAFETQMKNARGAVRDIQGVWVNRPRKHRYAYIIDKSLKCLYAEQERPTLQDGIQEYSCCNGTKIVHDRRYGVDYTCPVCTGHLYKLIDGKEVVPAIVQAAEDQITLWA